MAEETDLSVSFQVNSQSHTTELDHQGSCCLLSSQEAAASEHTTPAMIRCYCHGCWLQIQFTLFHCVNQQNQCPPPRLTATELVTGQWGCCTNASQKSPNLPIGLASRGNRPRICSHESASHWLSLNKLWDPAASTPGDFPASAELKGHERDDRMLSTSLQKPSQPQSNGISNSSEWKQVMPPRLA